MIITRNFYWRYKMKNLLTMIATVAVLSISSFDTAASEKEIYSINSKVNKAIAYMDRKEKAEELYGNWYQSIKDCEVFNWFMESGFSSVTREGLAYSWGTRTDRGLMQAACNGSDGSVTVDGSAIWLVLKNQKFSRKGANTINIRLDYAESGKWEIGYADGFKMNQYGEALVSRRAYTDVVSAMNAYAMLDNGIYWGWETGKDFSLGQVSGLYDELEVQYDYYVEVSVGLSQGKANLVTALLNGERPSGDNSTARKGNVATFKTDEANKFMEQYLAVFEEYNAW